MGEQNTKERKEKDIEIVGKYKLGTRNEHGEKWVQWARWMIR